MPIELAAVTPDFNDLVTQLQTQLATKDAWKDRLTTSTGQTLVEMIAAIGAYSQYSIESAYQEVWPQSAKNANSLYAACNFLGVRVNRKAPASFTLQFDDQLSESIPAYTQFIGAGSYWYNREAVVPYVGVGVGPFSLPTVTLYQGQIQTATFNGLGSNFQAFVTTEADFNVADQDITLQINGTSVPVIQEGLWTKPSLPGVQDLTLPSGQMMLLFGNADTLGNVVYGSRPGVNDTCVLTYVLTLGLNGNNIPTIGKTFTMESDPTIIGRTHPSVGNEQAAGGGDQTSYVVYKNITPALFGSFSSSITASQYKRLPLQYPGVLDAKVFAQREINPFALTWMNVVKVCLLTESVYTDQQWIDFTNWYQDQTMYSTRIIRHDPSESSVEVSARIYCKNFANTTQVKANALTALIALFAPRQGIIGLDIYRSDIISAMMQSDSNIEYIILDFPWYDVILSSFVVGAPSAQVSTDLGGQLAIGSYDYAISATSIGGGESSPANWVTVDVTVDNSTVSLSWTSDLPNVTGFKVWGRHTPDSLGVIATTGPSDMQYADSGANAPTGGLLVQGSIATYYPHLEQTRDGLPSLSVFYSTRDALA